jgi:Protein of unknown function (DUF3606)
MNYMAAAESPNLCPDITPTLAIYFPPSVPHIGLALTMNLPIANLRPSLGRCRLMRSSVARSAETKRIDLNDSNEVSYWAEQLGVSRERIVRAVYTVGPMLFDVRREVMEAA